MLNKTTLIFGGSKGIGSIIKQVLVERGDHVYTASRTDLSAANHFKIDLLNQIEIDDTI